MLVLAVALSVTATSPPVASAAEPLQWSSPTHVSQAETLLGVSCGSTALCVATEDGGQPQGPGAVTSTDPASLDPTWTPTPIEPYYTDEAISCDAELLCVAGNSAGELFALTDPAAALPPYTTTSLGDGPTAGISCTSTAFCVAVTVTNRIAISEDPTNLYPTWTEAPYPGSQALYGVSCVATELCVVGADSGTSMGELFSSTDLAASARTWTTSVLGTEPGLFPEDVSCASTKLCLAAGPGFWAVSTDPTAASPYWAVNYGFGSVAFTDVSCVSSVAGELCALIDTAGEVFTSSDPGGINPTWEVTDIDGSTYLRSVSCPSVSLCVVVDNMGNVMVGKSTHTVSVTLDGTGTGTVAGPGMQCPDTCSDTYAVGGSVVLSAVPAAGSTFAGWKGACSGSGPCNVTVNADESVSAEFDTSVPSTPPSPSTSSPTPTATPPPEPTATAPTVAALAVPVTTGRVSAIGRTEATLHASVDPRGGELSGCKFEYGRSLQYGAVAPCSTSPRSAAGTVAASAVLTGLRPNTLYHDRVVVLSSGGISYGADQTFRTSQPEVVPDVKLRTSAVRKHQGVGELGLTEIVILGTVKDESVLVDCRSCHGVPLLGPIRAKGSNVVFKPQGLTVTTRSSLVVYITAGERDGRFRRYGRYAVTLSGRLRWTVHESGCLAPGGLQHTACPT
jgi:List-Bact-rpt repeat protein